VTAVDLTIDPHPLLDVAAFTTTLDRPLSGVPSPPWLVDLLRPDAPVDLQPDDALRTLVRDLLRHGGFKPAGRSKPASEYLAGAAADGRLGPINALVDACNVASLHGGLPISVIDLDRSRGPWSIRIAGAESYVFNASGQTIDIAGLICLCDADGPCANAVKDAQRTKTHGGTTRTLSVVWGTVAAPGRTARVADLYRSLLGRLGAVTEAIR
jgi:DNA/RNA-binding domain of Phe-tRNA-synthetase-like protein